MIISSIRNIIAIVFLSIGKMIAAPTKKQSTEKKSEKPKPAAAIDFPPTSDFNTFLKRLSNKDIKGGPAVNNVFAMASKCDVPVCYDLRINTVFDNGFTLHWEHRVLAKHNGRWDVVASLQSHNTTCDGLVEDIILAAAARGWNCTEPASAIISDFTASVIRTQENNRHTGSKTTTDVVHVQFFMPHKNNPPKMTIRIYDPNSRVSETNSPHITIPFFKAAQKSKKTQAS